MLSNKSIHRIAQVVAGATPAITKDTSFYVVTKPTGDSTINDILFQTNLSGLALQIKGGLDVDASEPQIFFDYEPALEVATQFINNQ